MRNTELQLRRAPAEHVVYRYDSDRLPTITYHSTPHALSGCANTLDDARESYRSTMATFFGIGEHELPPVIEHLEARVGGLWVRTKVGAVHRDRVIGQIFMQTFHSGAAQYAVRDYVSGATSPGASPVLVIVEPDDTVGAVLDQMRTVDVLVIVHSDVGNTLGWVALCGPDAGVHQDALRIADHADVRAMRIDVFARTYAPAAEVGSVRLQHDQLRPAG